MRATAIRMIGLGFALALVTSVIWSMAWIAPAAAGERLVPGWLKSIPAKKTVEITMIAAYNGNNGSWNYDGYYSGGVTVVVPLGWTVKMRFENRDGNYPHSILITKVFTEDEIPDEAGREEVAVSRAYSNSPKEGCLSCTEDFRFKVKTAGEFLMFCGVLGHGQAGMWNYLTVSEEASGAYMTIAPDALTPEDQPPYE